MSKMCKIMAFLVLLWAFHIPYSLSTNVVEIYFKDSNLSLLILNDVVIFIIFTACLLVFVGKKYIYFKWQSVATLIANFAFILAWIIGFGVSISFYCRYYWKINCANDPENNACFAFPIDIDIAYLLCCVPMLLMLITTLYFAFSHKMLSKKNCLWLSLLLIFMLISIMIYFRGNGVGCYD